MSIKFSQFNAVSSISSSGYIVGYDGANNVRIKTSTADRLFAFTGGSLQFVQLTNAMVPTNTIGIDKLVNLAGLSVLGNATNASAAMAAITAANDNEVLLRSGTSLVFSKIGTDNINNSAITFAKIQNITPQRFVGRNSSPAGPPEEVNISQALEWLSSTANTIAYRNGSAWAALTASTDGYVLRLSGGALGFGQIDYNSISFSATQRILGRNTAGAGTSEEVTTAQILEWLSSTANTIAYRGTSAWTTLTASTNGHILRLSGGVLGFGQIDYNSISFTATQRILGRNTSGAGTSEEVTTAQILEWLSSTQNTIAYRNASAWTTLTATSNGQVLRLTGGALGFGQIATGGIEDAAVTYAKIQNVSATSRVLGRKTAGAGVIEELTTSELLDFISSTQGSILYRGASGWAALGPGTSGYFLQTNGPAADPTWAAGGGGGGGIGGSTGGTDNSVLRADGTGGATLQNSDVTIDDATTSTQANVTIANIHSGQTNSSLVLSPKGTGALILGPKPNAAASGGNARGVSAVDLQVTRSAATQVASANYSAILGGEGNTVSGTHSAAVGQSNTISAIHCFVAGQSNNISVQRAAAFGGGNSVSKRGGFVGGETNTVNGEQATVFGLSNNAQGNFSFIAGNDCQTNATGTAAFGGSSRANGVYSFASGIFPIATLRGQHSQASGRFVTNGDCQRSTLGAFRSITGTAATNLYLDGASVVIGLPATNSVWQFKIQLVAVCTTTGGSINANDVFGGTYEGVIKRVGATTSIVGTVTQVNTWSDGGFVANVPTVAITADNTANEALDIQWTTTGGAAGTVVRVNARIDLAEIGW